MRQQLMTSQVTIEVVDHIPGDSRVVHYDELEPAAKEQFFELATQGPGSVRGDSLRGFESYDIVKFTDYYRISVN